MNYLKLIETDFDVLKKIEEAEKNGDFSAHLDPIDYSLAEPVTADFPYIPDFLFPSVESGCRRYRSPIFYLFYIEKFLSCK